MNASDIERINKQGKITAVLDIEGGFDLDGDLGGAARSLSFGLALGATLCAQLHQQFCRLVLLAAQVARSERARLGSDTRNEPARNGY